MEKGFMPAKELREHVKKAQQELADELKCPADKIPVKDVFDRTGIATRQIAVMLGITAQELHKQLNDAGVIFRQGNIWCPYAQYVNKGYGLYRHNCINRSSGEVQLDLHWRWTMKGYLFIKYLLASGKQQQHNIKVKNTEMQQMEFNFN